MALNETVDIGLEFIRNDGLKVSSGHRVDVLADTPEAVELTPVVYSDLTGKATIKLKAIQTGTVTLTFTDKTSCGIIAFTKEIAIN